MSVSDPISDFLTRIRNAAKARKEAVTVPASKMKIRIAEILHEEGFVSNVKVVEDEGKKSVRIYLKYLKGNKSAIKSMRRISTPAIHRYVEVDRIPKVMNGLGVVILSTSKGVMTGAQAKKENVGGELVCSIA